GLLFPLSLASQGSAQIGGVLGTNAGGVNVLRYGNARDLCLGLEVVLADGRIWHGLSGLHKDNTGYDFRHLMIGAEGTLGVITAAVLRLFAQPAQQQAAWIAVKSPVAALSLLGQIRAGLGDVISAYELIDRTGLEFLGETGVMTLPAGLPDAPWLVLLDCAAGPGDDLTERIEAALGAAFEAELCHDALISQSEAQRASFWQIREMIPEANRAIGAVSSHDIALPLAALPAFISAARAAIAPELRINCFGHLGDGNLHFNVFPPLGKKGRDYRDHAAAVKRTVYDLVAAFGGSFSAEHGIGRMKLDELRRYGDPVKLEMMRAIKAALDPVGILNPGALVPEV
ncbi:MAG: FAD-binding oxidoreductase, partial [Paracoccaceae bacterium]